MTKQQRINDLEKVLGDLLWRMGPPTSKPTFGSLAEAQEMAATILAYNPAYRDSLIGQLPGHKAA